MKFSKLLFTNTKTANISNTALNTYRLVAQSMSAREIILDSLIKGNQFNTEMSIIVFFRNYPGLFRFVLFNLNLTNSRITEESENPN